jgi:predicted flap endonuclease-1-like 5' DNA nuclease
MAKKIEEIEGIGPDTAGKLAAAGITTVEQYLEAACDPKGRKELAEKTGIGDSRILKFANQADLFRVSGVSTQYAELLEAAGVDTVKELAQRNAENLAAKMAEVNEAKNLVRQTPAAATVADWVEQAKNLPRKVVY